MNRFRCLCALALVAVLAPAAFAQTPTPTPAPLPEDPDGFTEVHHMTTRQIAAVTQDANTLARLAGQHRSDLHALETRLPRELVDPA